MFKSSADLRNKYRGVCDSACQTKRNEVEKQINEAQANVETASARDDFSLVGVRWASQFKNYRLAQFDMLSKINFKTIHVFGNNVKPRVFENLTISKSKQS